MSLKVCRTCDKVQPSTEFYETSLSCKPCVRARTRAGEVAVRRHRGTDGTAPQRISKMTQRERRAYWATYKREQGCTDCPTTDWRTLEFDHLPQFEKSFTIGEAIPATSRYSDEEIEAEVAKCEVVCRRCHVIRSGKRSARRARDQFTWDVTA